MGMSSPSSQRNVPVENDDDVVARRQPLASHFVVVCLSVGLTVMAAAALWPRAHPPSQTARFDSNLIDINAADWTSFSQLEGIGPTLGFRIVAEREHFGPFKTIDDLLRVEGIGPLTLDRIRYRLTIGHDQLKPIERQQHSEQ